jgi:ATP-dependent Clp protease ATP-binding subunit ClpA
VTVGDPLELAYAEAEQLGHGWIGAEHLVLALLREPTAAGESLRRAGLDHESYRQAFESASNYIGMRSTGLVGGEGKVVSADVQEVLARAEGIAAAQGEKMVLAKHALLSLLWARSTLVALTLIERIGPTRQEILGELHRRGIGLDAPAPALPAWGEWVRVERGDFESLAAGLRRDGMLYRYSEQADGVLISIARRSHRSRISR